MSKLPPMIVTVWGDGQWSAQGGFPRRVIRGTWRSTPARGATVEFVEDEREDVRDPIRKAVKQILIAMSYV